MTQAATIQYDKAPLDKESKKSHYIVYSGRGVISFMKAMITVWRKTPTEIHIYFKKVEEK